MTGHSLSEAMPESIPREYNAYAKVNLCLKVTGVREDGYHLVDMVNVEIGLTDRLRFQLTGEPGIHLVCDDPGIPTGEANLCVRAAQRYLRAIDREGTGLSIELEKAIPAGGGVGGGSADAAATLRYLSEVLPGLSQEEQIDLAVDIGADVPFGLVGGAARVRGIGERVEPLRQRREDGREAWIVLIMPGVHSDTPAAYKAWDTVASPRSGLVMDGHGSGVETVAKAVRRGEWDGLPALLFNDLCEPVFELIPALRDLHREASVVLDLPVWMTGSGSNLFALVRSEAEAQAVSTRWSRRRTSAPCPESRIGVYPILA